jgi:hypothetical protein
MMRADFVTGPFRRGFALRLHLLVGMSSTLFLAVVAFAMSRSVWQGRRPAPGLEVEPSAADITDKVYIRGEKVKAVFHLRNPTDRDITVRSIQTSCSCMVSAVEGGSKPPFVIPAAGQAAFSLSANTSRMLKPVQDFHAGVISAQDGKALPELPVTLRLRVDDPLRAYPPLVRLARASVDHPTEWSAVLATMSPDTSVDTPEVKVSDPDLMRASIVEIKPGMKVNDVPGCVPRYLLRVSILPQRGRAATTGSIQLSSRGRGLTEIPVECSFKEDYRLWPDSIDVEGQPGETIDRKLYYEPISSGWTDIHPVSLPDGVRIETGRYGDTTKILRLRITIPSKGPDGSRTLRREITLGFPGNDKLIRIPVDYSIFDRT